MSNEQLTAGNYFSQTQYMSASQFKDFNTCEARALAKYNGEWEFHGTTAMLMGSYVDAYLDNSMDKFTSKHPEIFTRTGSLRSEFTKANNIIARLTQSEEHMRLLTGNRQVPVQGKIAGVKCKGLIDNLLDTAIVDGKVMRDLKDVWVRNGYQPWWKAYGYDVQGAIYQELVFQQTGKKLPFLLAVVTKEDTPDIAVYQLSQDTLDTAMDVIKSKIMRFAMIKDKIIDPERCECCDYCKSTKNVTINDYILV